MKKFMTAILFMGLAAGCGSALANEAKITQLTGEAFIANADGIHRVKPGMGCDTGDMIMTRAGCHLDLAISGQAGCRLLPNTTAALASTERQRTKIMVAEGNVVLNIKKLEAGSQFTVDTPTAVAAVRGTQFWGRVTGPETASPVTTFAVREGTVEIYSKASNQSATLNAGQAADLDSEARQLVVRPALQDELAAMAAADQIATTA